MPIAWGEKTAFSGIPVTLPFVPDSLGYVLIAVTAAIPEGVDPITEVAYRNQVTLVLDPGDSFSVGADSETGSIGVTLTFDESEPYDGHHFGFWEFPDGVAGQEFMFTLGGCPNPESIPIYVSCQSGSPGLGDRGLEPGPGDPPDEDEFPPLAAPSDLHAEYQEDGSILLTWEDHSDNETQFAVDARVVKTSWSEEIDEVWIDHTYEFYPPWIDPDVIGPYPEGAPSPPLGGSDGATWIPYNVVSANVTSMVVDAAYIAGTEIGRVPPDQAGFRVYALNNEKYTYYSYCLMPPLAELTVSPNSGSQAGGTAVTITVPGANFV